MTFQDVFKSSFLENVTAVSLLDMAIALALAFAVGVFIFFVYKKTYKGVMYSSTFGVTLIALTMIATLVILAVTSNVVLSLDGRPQVQDAMRPTANGKGSYDLCLANMKKLVARRGDKEYYIRGTFTAKNLDFTQDVKHLRSLGFEQLSLEPVVLPDDSPYAILESHVQRVLEEYDTLADYVFESRQKPETWLNFFHFMVDLSGGPCLKKRIAG